MPLCQVLLDARDVPSGVCIQGDVRIVCDAASLYCQVYQIQGMVTASNFILIDPGDIALRGPFIYILLRPRLPLPFVLHMILTVGPGNPLRLTLSKSCSDPVATSTAIQLPLDLDDRWQYVALDIPTILQQYTPAHQTAPFFRGLRSIQLCANLRVKGIFGSRNPLHPNDLPRAMQMPVPKGKTWVETFNWVWLPFVPMTEASAVIRQSGPSIPNLKSGESLRRSPTKSHSPRSRSPSPPIHATEVAGNLIPEDPLKPPLHVHRWLDGHVTEESLSPAMVLHRILGPGCDGIRPVVHSARPHHVLYPAGAVLVEMNASSGMQQHAISHDTPITHLAVMNHGPLAATSQKGKVGLLRIWDIEAFVPLAFVPIGEVIDMCFGQIGHVLLTVSTTLRRPFKSVITLWDCNQAAEGHVFPQITYMPDYPIYQVGLVPFEEDRFVTCSSDTLRFHRVKSGQVRKCSLIGVLTSPKPHFLCFTFQAGLPSSGLERPHLIFAGTTDGRVYKIAYSSRTVVSIYQLHQAAIRAIDVQQDICVTASDDSYLRVWSTDFSSSFLEAEHDSAVVSCSLAPDGTEVFTGTQSGEIGFLSLVDRQYTALSRSHTGDIVACAMRPSAPQLATASRDNSLRFWDLNSGTQLFQVDCLSFSQTICSAVGYLDDRNSVVTSLEYHPTLPHLMVGFLSGHLHILDIEGGALLVSARPHNAALQQLMCTHDGHWLVSTSTSALCIHSTSMNYDLIKAIPCPSPCPPIWVAQAWQSAIMAVAGAEGPGAVSLYDTTEFTAWQPKQTFVIAAAPDEEVLSAIFSNDDGTLFASSTAGVVYRVDIGHGYVQQFITGCSLVAGALQMAVGGRWLLYAEEQGLVHAVNTENGEAQKFAGHVSTIRGIWAHPSLPVAVTVDSGAQIHLWNIAT